MEKNLTSPLTLVLSRRGREEMKGKNLKAPPPFPSSTGRRGKKEDEKNLTEPLILPTTAGWRGMKEKKKGVIRF
jgi:hypothetical protein